MRGVLDGESVTSAPGGRYAFDDLRHQPTPDPAATADHDRRQRREEDPADRREVRRHVERDGLGGRHGPQGEVLKEHCAAVGRNIDEIEFTLGVKFTIRDSKAEADRVWQEAMAHNRTPMSDVADDDTFWNGSPEELADRLRPYVDLGFRTVISEQPAPYDVETLERFVGEVKPLIDAG